MDAVNISHIFVSCFDYKFIHFGWHHSPLTSYKFKNQMFFLLLFGTKWTNGILFSVSRSSELGTSIVILFFFVFLLRKVKEGEKARSMDEMDSSNLPFIYD